MLLQGNSSSIAQKSSEIWTVQADLQPISFKFDRLLQQGVFRTTLSCQSQQSGRDQARTRVTGMVEAWTTL